MSPAQLASFQDAITKAQDLADSDDRSYQSWAGIHGLPLPAFCRHASHIFLPWHRAYLYFFEKELQDRVAGVTFPWWDWTAAHAEGIPEAFSKPRTSERRKNPLYDSPIQKIGRRNPSEARTWRETGSGPPLPSSDELSVVLDNTEFNTFQNQLEILHNRVHGWVGGTMNDPNVAAYDPIFWAHHTMIDRCWYLWQLRHPGAGPSENLLDHALPPFAMTVRQTLDITSLGYDYAASTAAVGGPGGG